MGQLKYCFEPVEPVVVKSDLTILSDRMVNIRAFVIVALFICAANAAVFLPVLEDEELEKGLPAFRLDSDDADDVLMKVLPELGDDTNTDRDGNEKNHEEHHDDPAHIHGNHGDERN